MQYFSVAKQSNMQKYDLIIIGGGAGAFAAAIRANELNAKTTMINTGIPLGGTCVNVGCVPSKALLHAAEILHLAKNHKVPGIELQLKKFVFQEVVKDELDLVNQLRNEKYETVLKDLKNVTLISGKAKFISPNEVDVEGQRFSADKFIIAAGSTANVPPIKGIKEAGYITHVEALKLKTQPKELIIIGGGPVGLEFAQMFSRFSTKVTILQRGPSIFPQTEKVLTDRLQEILIQEGINIKTTVEVKATRTEKGKKIVSYAVNGESEEVAADEILLATGKTPNTAGLGLDKAGVEIDKKQAIIVNQFLETSQSHIFAVGDINNQPLRLEPTAGNEGTSAAENALTDSKRSLDYNTVPYTIFTDPQLAGVGWTEEETMKRLNTCSCRTVSFKDVPKALIIKRTEGLIKMGINPNNKQIVGVHILAPNAGDLIAEAMVLIKNKNTIDDVVNSLPMFPTLSEAIKIAALSFTKDISKLSCCI